jgi:hypothetical protein
MLFPKLPSFVIFVACVRSAHISIERRQNGCEEFGNYPPYTGPCETESA